VVQKN
jgi:hypothetical protein